MQTSRPKAFKTRPVTAKKEKTNTQSRKHVLLSPQGVEGVYMEQPPCISYHVQFYCITPLVEKTALVAVCNSH
jgi:hypothetical protein